VPITVGQVLTAWKDRVSGRSDLVRYKPLCDLIELEYAHVPAAEFGPRRLNELRETLLADGKRSRKWINEQIRVVWRIFKHAVSLELIEYRTYNKLTTLEPLKRGYTTAREQVPRQPVPLEHIAATIAELTPVLAAMVRIQLATGMRSAEVCRIRPCDIDRSGAEWIYRPAAHKTAHHGISKAVPIVGFAREALQPFLDRPTQDFCLSPTESDEWHRSRRRSNRSTPLKYEKRQFAHRQRKNRYYHSDSYRQAIQRAAKRAGVPKMDASTDPAHDRHRGPRSHRLGGGSRSAGPHHHRHDRALRPRLRAPSRGSRESSLADLRFEGLTAGPRNPPASLSHSRRAKTGPEKNTSASRDRSDVVEQERSLDADQSASSRPIRDGRRGRAGSSSVPLAVPDPPILPGNPLAPSTVLHSIARQPRPRREGTRQQRGGDDCRVVNDALRWQPPLAKAKWKLLRPDLARHAGQSLSRRSPAASRYPGGRTKAAETARRLKSRGERGGPGSASDAT
jgi:integrase